MTDVKMTCETIAALLARSGVSARAIKNQPTEWAVEARLEENTRVLWAQDPKTGSWGYSFLGKSGGIEDYGSITPDVLGEPSPERIAYVIANYPYSGELDGESAKQIVNDLLSQVEDLTDDEREAILNETIAEPEASGMLSWGEFRESGMLWAINRYVLHPRGFALVFRYEDSGEAVGWAVLGSGSEPMTTIPAWDASGFSKFESFLDGLQSANT